MDPRSCRTPVVLDRVFDDPDLVPRLVERGSPYWTVQRYLRNTSEMTSLSDAGRRADADRPMLVAPWFRGDWAFERPLVPGVEAVLEEPRFAEAARRLFDAEVVVPQQVYVNLNPPMPQVDPGHLDVPTFRGVTRRDTPIWLLSVMLKSGLFERWYQPLATAVAWYYDGVGGGFRYWPDGPDAAPIDRPCASNTAVVGDNDRMFHCVLSIGASPTLVRGLTLDSKLHVQAGRARIEEAGQVLADHDARALRVSVSWKALVFPSDAARAAYERGDDALTLDEVFRRFADDLARRGEDATVPEHPLEDRAFVDRLNRAYAYAPTVFRPRA